MKGETVASRTKLAILLLCSALSIIGGAVLGSSLLISHARSFGFLAGLVSSACVAVLTTYLHSYLCGAVGTLTRSDERR